MSGSGGSSTTQKADPWSGVQPYLKGLYSNANDLSSQGGPQVAQNSGVAGFTPEMQSALSAILSRSGGSGLEGQAQSLTSNIASGTDPLSQSASANSNNVNQAYNGLNRSLADVYNGSTAQGGAYNSMINGTDASSQAYQGMLNGGDAQSMYLKDVIGGKYLNNNPYLSAATDAANSDTTRQFQSAVMPQLASQFSMAGRYGSGAQSQGISDATNNLAKQISNTNANIYNQDYQMERGNQNSAAGLLGNYVQNAASGLAGIKQAGASGMTANQLGAMSQMGSNTGNMASNNATTNNFLSGRQSSAIAALPGMANIDWNNLNNALSAGQLTQGQAQDQLAGNNALFNANQQQPYQNLNWLNGILSGAMSLNGQSSSTSGGALKSVGTGALSGAMTGAALGSVFPGVGTAMGAGLGAAGGGLLGIL